MSRVNSTIDPARAYEKSWDCVVIGAGPAGTGTAIALRSYGLSVLLIDKQHFPRNKICGCCLNSQAVSQLTALGILEAIKERGAIPLQKLVLECSSKTHLFKLKGGLAISREVLDVALLNRAIEAGADYLSGEQAKLIDESTSDPAIVLRSDPSRQISAAAIVLATGLAGGALRSSGKHAALIAQTKAGSRIGFGGIAPADLLDIAAGSIHMLIRNEGYVGLTRLEDHRIDIAAAVDAVAIRGENGLSTFVQQTFERHRLALSASLNDIEVDWQATPGLTRTPKLSAQRRVFLVGDAAGYVEPFTGEGIGWALRSSLLLAPIIAAALANPRTDYSTQWGKLYNRNIKAAHRKCRRLTKLLRTPFLFGSGVQLVQSSTILTNSFLRTLNHKGESPSL